MFFEKNDFFSKCKIEEKYWEFFCKFSKPKNWKNKNKIMAITQF
jgi:hypothetical protein